MCVQLQQQSAACVLGCLRCRVCDRRRDSWVLREARTGCSPTAETPKQETFVLLLIFHFFNYIYENTHEFVGTHTQTGDVGLRIHTLRCQTPQQHRHPKQQHRHPKWQHRHFKQQHRHPKQSEPALLWSNISPQNRTTNPTLVSV